MNAQMVSAVCLFVSGVALAPGCQKGPQEIERPPAVVSKRSMVYDVETYRALAASWKDYHDVVPSEVAYANWMYAARYAGDQEYRSLLSEGRTRYPANPTLLYLMAMASHGKKDNTDALHLLERAAKLDPAYMDPWFGLVIHHLERGDVEGMNLSLRRLLEGGAIADEIMDYSYNMLRSLGKDAVLVTNGDNDTYPGWVLTGVLGYRPDITIVNRSLLNTEWYPASVIAAGVPAFVTPARLQELRDGIEAEVRSGRYRPGPGGPIGDTLVALLVETCRAAGRSVYLSKTVDGLEMYRSGGQDLGLVTFVGAPADSHRPRVQQLLSVWSNEFRTAGLDAWSLRHAPVASAGRMLMSNYAAGIRSLMPEIRTASHDTKVRMFRWYRTHLAELLPPDQSKGVDDLWCELREVSEIRDWCRSMNDQR